MDKTTLLMFQATDKTLRAFQDTLEGFKGTTMRHHKHNELEGAIIHTRLLVNMWCSSIHRSSQPSPIPKPLQIRSSIS
jgi:hypothetical protein